VSLESELGERYAVGERYAKLGTISRGGLVSS
jgi:hypothetical protein